MKLLQTIYNRDFVHTVATWNLKGQTAIFHVFVPFDLQDRQAEADKVREALEFLYIHIYLSCSYIFVI